MSLNETKTSAINVILIGPSQHGKSALLQAIAQQGHVPIEPFPSEKVAEKEEFKKKELSFGGKIMERGKVLFPRSSSPELAEPVALKLQGERSRITFMDAPAEAGYIKNMISHLGSVDVAVFVVSGTAQKHWNISEIEPDIKQVIQAGTAKFIGVLNFWTEHYDGEYIELTDMQIRDFFTGLGYDGDQMPIFQMSVLERNQAETQDTLCQLIEALEEYDFPAQEEAAPAASPEFSEHGLDKAADEDIGDKECVEDSSDEYKKVKRLIYTLGISTAMDYAAQIKELKRMALSNEGDTAEALFGLGMVYLFGYGVKEDTAEATYWCHRAAELGHAGAEQLLQGATPVSPYGDPVSAVTERVHSFGFKWVQDGTVDEKCRFIDDFPEDDLQRILELLSEGEQCDWNAFILLFENFLRDRGIVALLEKVDQGQRVHREFLVFLLDEINAYSIPYWFGLHAHETSDDLLKKFDRIFIKLLAHGNTSVQAVGQKIAGVFQGEFQAFDVPQNMNPEEWKVFLASLREKCKES